MKNGKTTALAYALALLDLQNGSERSRDEATRLRQEYLRLREEDPSLPEDPLEYARELAK